MPFSQFEMASNAETAAITKTTKILELLNNIINFDTSIFLRLVHYIPSSLKSFTREARR